MPALIERPKMSLAMWAALKTHIMKQREKKKQEQEADAAVERLKREQEIKRKQDAMTLEEIKEQVAQLNKKLGDLKNEKHELFLCLKRVLNEDEKRRNEEEKEPNDMVHMSHHYTNQTMPTGAPNLYMLGNTLMNRNPAMYKVGIPHTQQNGALKRPRSPSPTNASYPQAYGYKGHVTAYGQTYPVPHPANQYPTQEQAKHLSVNYHAPHLQQQSYVAAMNPQPLEHPGPKPSSVQDEKYYLQQTGSITAGYPVRTQPQPVSRFQPPTSRGVNSALQVAPMRKEDIRHNLASDAHR